ncbi:molybdenum cofactor sulfurase [Fusarium flagelliforme]|uniref:Molybdenum cofactor sulfurase n=1 Tax=Fusarium flagelliforme TaxID=2675880 RepID=A0A395MZ59_9HYPO|nr:molybdenum cofactor sulfurase [Fusarium flagelliforme]
MEYNSSVEEFRDDEYPNMAQGAYLDHGGTTIYARSLIAGFSQAMIGNLWGNPHSENLPAKLSGEMVDSIRAKTLDFLGADPEHFDLVFVANATAGIKLVADAFRDLGDKTPSKGFWYGCHREAHTSLIGIRALAPGDYHCFNDDESVEEWISRPFNCPKQTRKGYPSSLGLFAYPGQSNLSGRRLPKTWPRRIRKHPQLRNTYTLFDAAALAMTSSLSSLFEDPSGAPDFTCLSLYKIFGFPDLGALVVRRASGHILCLRRYFGGGTVAQLSPLQDTRVMKKVPGLGNKHMTWNIHDGLEDGTLPFHSILALGIAIDTHLRLYGSMDVISRHCSYLARSLYERLADLKHRDGSPVVELYADEPVMYGDPSAQGPTFAFNIMREDGSYVPWTEVERLANNAGVYIRAGGVCCPGGVSRALNYEEWEWDRIFSSGHACGSSEMAVVHNKPTGIVRASLGAMTTKRDIEAFVSFLRNDIHAIVLIATMAKKKSKQATAAEGQNATLDQVSQTQTQPSSTTTTNSSANGVQKKKAKASKELSSASSSQTLNICRNKHWRYISSYHGPWLQMPIEILETIANINYNTPRPRPIDPAVLFDLLKIRRLVDEATNLAVRAASDIASPVLTNVHGGLPGSGSMSALGMTGPGHGMKLSHKRKSQMREQASQKLSRAYHLDEIACSVATMQGASTIEEIGAVVLQRNPQDPDAKYVHFFHEKIPSRQLAESTSLQPLTEIISERPNESEALRTRAIVRTFKEDYEGAAQDLTTALAVCRIHQQPHRPSEEVNSQQLQTGKRWRQEVVPAEKDQPSSLEIQLSFLRATTYLSLACQHIEHGLSLNQKQNGHVDSAKSNAKVDAESDGQESQKHDENSLLKQTEARKLVKKYAKWALRDLLTYLSHFEYAPNLPNLIAKDFNDRVNLSAQGARNPRPSEATYLLEPHTTYNLAELFASVPPSDLPPYPNEEVTSPNRQTQLPDPPTTCELLTYHPLMTDALHSLLLCHCLIQTSAKEVQRHTYMAARLIRLADGYPIFQASRSPARSDWLEVLRRADDSWLQLSASWDTLCTPAPLPLHYDTLPPGAANMHTGASRKEAAAAAASLINGGSNADKSVPSAEEQRRLRMRERDQRVRLALSDQRVCDEDTFRAAIEAQEKRAEQEDRAAAAAAAAREASPDGASNPDAHPKRWVIDDSKEYPVCTARATLIAQWVCEAPVVTGTTRRKKRTKRPEGKADTLVASAEKMSLKDDAVAGT